MFLLIFFSCCKSRMETSVDSAVDFISDEVYTDSEMYDIQYIDIYAMHPEIVYWSSYMSVDGYNRVEVTTKERIENIDEFKYWCDYKIRLTGKPMWSVIVLLLNAKPVKKLPAKRKINTDNIRGIQGGMIIEIHRDSEYTQTFIMDNDGRNIFYEKGKEEKYFKMPKILLNKFYLTYSETLRNLPMK